MRKDRGYAISETSIISSGKQMLSNNELTEYSKFSNLKTKRTIVILQQER